jgi:16S rRNA (uracil1498-N3)-methyltransferase
MTRAPVPDLEAGERTLGGAVAHYLVRVLRLRAGDAFVAFDPATGREADAVTLWAQGDAVSVRFGPARDGRARAERELVFVQGFAKGDKCDAVVRDATELGATRVIVAVTKRSVVRLDEERAEARQARWARIAEDAARQCGRSDPPLVDRPHTWEGAISSLASMAGPCARFCLYEQATEPLAPPLFEALANGANLAFACGPEGGLEAVEVELARQHGWVVASLGPLALRTETVAAAVLGAVRIWSGLTR